MPIRPNPALIAAGVTFGALAAPALAQQIDYSSGQYQYPTEQTAAENDTVVTRTVAGDETPRPAVRVIPMREAGLAPVFVSNPVVQGVVASQPAGFAAQARVPAEATAAARVIAPAPTMAVLPSGPVYYTYQVAAPVAPTAYAYPAGAASRVIYPAGAAQPVATRSPAAAYQQTYIATAAPLPPGAQLVSFDPAIWLAACRDRLATYDPADRDAAIASLGFAAAGYAPGGDHCAAYLDSYMASAAAGTLAAPRYYGQQYMLVPAPAMVVATPEN